MNWLNRSVALGALLCLLAAGAQGKEKKKEDAKLSVPVPVGAEAAKGVTVPIFDAEGKKKMEFYMATATRPDEGHLEMTQMRLQTFTETGAVDMLIDMPVSVLDLETKIISSARPVMVRRSDFEIVGETMEFDSSTKMATITGKTRMLIFDKSGASTGIKTDE